MSVDDIFHVCLEALQKHALLRREWVEDYHLRKIEHAYPRFRIGYNRILRSLFDFINDIENLVSFGRQGLFSYANVDDVMWMAFEVTKNLAYKERLKLQMEEILPDYIDF
jgi:protoporphyrinogen oxidase